MNATLLVSLTTAAVIGLSASSIAAPMGGAGVGSPAAHSNGSFGYAPTRYTPGANVSDSRVLCSQHRRQLVLVNVSETTLPVRARIRYVLDKAPPREVQLGAPLHYGDALIVGSPVSNNFSCSAQVFF